MATIDSKPFVDNIIKHNGYYNGDDDNTMGDNPRCIKIVEYTNAWGNLAWGTIFEGEHDPQRYERPTEYIHNPRVLWEYKG
jgi:hypothetical protein